MTKINKSILKKVERVFKKLLRQRRDIGEIQFGFMPICGTAECHFYFEAVTGKIFSESELCICRF